MRVICWLEMLGHLRIISVLLFMHLTSFVHSCYSIQPTFVILTEYALNYDYNAHHDVLY